MCVCACFSYVTCICMYQQKLIAMLLVRIITTAAQNFKLLVCVCMYIIWPHMHVCVRVLLVCHLHVTCMYLCAPTEAHSYVTRTYLYHSSSKLFGTRMCLYVHDMTSYACVCVRYSYATCNNNSMYLYVYVCYSYVTRMCLYVLTEAQDYVMYVSELTEAQILCYSYVSVHHMHVCVLLLLCTLLYAYVPQKLGFMFLVRTRMYP